MPSAVFTATGKNAGSPLDGPPSKLAQHSTCRGIAHGRKQAGFCCPVRSNSSHRYRCAFFRQHPVLRARGDPSRHEPATGGFYHAGAIKHVESPMTMTTERRNFLKGVSAAAASTAVLAGTQALAQGSPQAAAKAMPYQTKPMPFDPKTITGISEKVLVSHYENNYVGAVKRL